jgi:hypothetical protein
MKQITALALFSIAGFVSIGQAMAQDHAVQATIPFEFRAGNKVLPAGTYTIATGTDNLIVITNHDQPAVVTVALRDGRDLRKQELVFDKYGDRYFLREILCRSAGMSLELPPSKVEKATRQQQAFMQGMSQVLIAAR